ncbi:membrane protein [Pseudomonas saudimassiliensis]|uniref:Membrane protein n=1 Tax=Pseudomonas saudimassiliensis TaxID=1461581 RepID=A0A078M1Z6_9PSED|nr:DMT family transporter [Pseudomonas saudimassiliensis]CEA00284.1 membrane protein [Pseudomonas saudimassiliensis]CEF25109.1 membrane protein [Pseudomonas saudimassiliensis]
MSARHWAVIGLMITALSWAGNALIARASAGMLPPIGLSFWRWSVALVLLLPFTLRGLWQYRRLLLDNGLRIAVLAALSISSYNTLLYQAAQSTSAINLTLVGTGLPVSAFFWSMLLLRQVPARATVGGTLLGLCGLLLILTGGQPARLLALHFNDGDLIMLAAVLSWGLYTVLLQRWVMPAPGLVLMAAMLLCGVPLLAPFFLWELAQLGPMPVTWPAAGAVGYTAVFASLVAYVAWNHGVKVLGPSTASLFSYLVPAFTALLGVALLGEQLYWYHLAGGALTFLGLLVATRWR